MNRTDPKIRPLNEGSRVGIEYDIPSLSLMASISEECWMPTANPAANPPEPFLNFT